MRGNRPPYPACGKNKETRPAAADESLPEMSRFLVFGRIEAGVVGERDLFAAIVIDALCESLHKLFAALTGRSER